MIDKGSQNLREMIRMLVRSLGILEKGDVCKSTITITQCHAIVEIGRRGKVSLIDLADMMDVDKSTMSRTVNNLVEAGLALRDVDVNNRRYVIIQLTDAGQKEFRSIEESMNGYFKSVFEAIPEEKRSQVLESLLLLTEAVKSSN